MKIAIMQPYFIPYPGYFRLFCAADLFVVYDCVQFPRRSFVHRNKLLLANKQLDWLTLPLEKQVMETPIKDLKFRDQIATDWQIHLNRFPGIQKLQNQYPTLYALLNTLDHHPVHFIVKCLREICHILDIPFNITYSAELGLPMEIKGQDRILAIAKFFQATVYINAPGGRALYTEDDFIKQNIKLYFLPEYQGDYHSIIQSLVDQTPGQIRATLFSQLI